MLAEFTSVTGGGEDLTFRKQGQSQEAKADRQVTIQVGDSNRAICQAPIGCVCGTWLSCGLGMHNIQDAITAEEF